MRLLLDTHVLLWWLADAPELGEAARGLIADSDNAILVSVVSLWEITIKARLGKLEASLEEIVAVLPDQGFQRLGVEDVHLAVLSRLPHHHRDPFDHLLIAQAMAENAVIMSQDANVPLYDVICIACT
ncbi:type II toxin-antitoxin system VapC family toxin [Asticcacaulis sp. EMRT-3]|uniref:type II toxin-antitoxin system VapC family toxin n=1 Tax=Asticcacaulis sp. EMRT-3 TaxID=3040349 RepID=UPI0024AFE1BE|nr:type II toxin-antitoxin system VapC family toxin [Asticcacaulis sp. EMRT-3]MDI7776444.1 type II toxin-antitoxin system VapC family toxin [Asticcacaulis sp. EMRT-3]